jgi:hypothetical protein
MNVKNVKLSRICAELVGISLLVLGYVGSVMGAVQVEGQYAIAIPGQSNGAAFMVLNNTGTQLETLIAAQSTVARAVELHTHTMVNGMMQMRQIDKIEVPEGAQVALARGGLHVMLIGLKQDQVTPGKSFSLTLIYKSGEQQTVQVPVRGMASPMNMGGMGHHHNP